MSALKTNDPLVVNTKGGVVWTLRAVSEDGSGWYAPEAVCSCPRFLLTPLSELAVLGITGSADVLPVPVGPERFPFPPEPRSEEERLRMEVVDLQDQLATALKDAGRASRERDLMRERVSEPYGCTYCGEAKRYHGRRYLSGMNAAHSWERPSDEQVKTRMLARRAARFTPYASHLASLLVARTEDLLAAEARISALEAERHSTNESLDEAATALRVQRDRLAELEAGRAADHKTWQHDLRTAQSEREAMAARIAELEALKPAAIQTCRKCGAGYTHGEPCSVCEFQARMTAEADVSPQVAKLRGILAGQRGAAEAGDAR